MHATDDIAIYAAVMSTGGLALQAILWCRAGARLIVKVHPEMTLIGNDDYRGEYVVANVFNRGDRPTTIVHFALVEFPTWWHRLFRRSRTSFVIPDPQPPGAAPIIPGYLPPGKFWIGLAHPRDETRHLIESGRGYIAIHATHRARPIIKRVRKIKRA